MYSEKWSVLALHLDIDSPSRLLQIKISMYPILEILNIQSDYTGAPCMFNFSLQQNNLHTLALSNCSLSTTDHTVAHFSDHCSNHVVDYTK